MWDNSQEKEQNKWNEESHFQKQMCILTTFKLDIEIVEKDRNSMNGINLFLFVYNMVRLIRTYKVGFIGQFQIQRK